MPALDNIAGPYINLHKDGPIRWRLWGPGTLAEAQNANKPIFMSIGYTGCRWCHVMNDESFSDPEIAALINENFIPVLVDREERPDLDQLYQIATPLMGMNSGWPLNIFLTPEGAPFFVTAYIPAEERLGAPSFRSVVRDTAALWNNRNFQAREQANQVAATLEGLFERDLRTLPEAILLNEAAIRLAQNYDIFFGGQLGREKFPHPTQLEQLWRAFLRTGVAQYSQLLFTTLDHILFGGLYDHIGGGFFRHARDERWLVPHFEKLLIDNAQLIDVMTGVWQFNRSDLCRGRVEETIEWLLREMKLPSGAFASGLNPDTEGEEGRFYLWTEDEIDAALAGTFSAKFKAVYEVKREGNYAGRNVLRRLGAGNGAAVTITDADEALMARQRGMLLEAREKRVRPARDDKMLADWNGLAIAAIANAGAVFERPKWVNAAIVAFDAVCAALDTNGTLHHSCIAGQKGTEGFANDYANMARAALQLYEVTGDKRFLTAALDWTNTLNSHFWDAQRFGYFFTSDHADPIFMRTRFMYDNVGPTANGVMLTVLARLILITGDQTLSRRGMELLTSLGAETTRGFLSMGSYFNGAEAYAAALQIVIFGAKSNARTQDLMRAVWSKALPNRLLLVIEPGQSLPEGHPAAKLQMQGGQPTAYICQGANCSAAITSAAMLSQVLTLQPPARTAN